uniref:Uncharacterized protein n=1 Tax=Globodera rostochiensis TaxID=31243 RepID=A0A914H607_GLORO
MLKSLLFTFIFTIKLLFGQFEAAPPNDIRDHYGVNGYSNNDEEPTNVISDEVNSHTVPKLQTIVQFAYMILNNRKRKYYKTAIINSIPNASMHGLKNTQHVQYVAVTFTSKIFLTITMLHKERLTHRFSMIFGVLFDELKTFV